MGFFKGQELYSIDHKGRVNVPAHMRKSIDPLADNTFNLMKGFEKCVYAYPLNEWKIQEEKFAQLNSYSKEHRKFKRIMLKDCYDVKLDGQGRIAIPKILLDKAGIKSKVTILGQDDHIEFWDPDEFEHYEMSLEESREEIAEKVMVL